MKLRKFNIDLDTKLKKSNPGIEVVQGDNISNILEINLFQDDEPYLLDNLTILTVFNKSDNTTVIQSSEDPELPILIKDNKATITLKSNSISASGLVVAEVSIYGGNDERLTSQRFTFYVRESLLSDDVIESTNELPVLVSLIKDVRGLLEKQIEMVESETIRVSNEVERIKTHEKLLILQSNLETLQISLENTEEQRQINESARENLKTSLESLQGDLLALEIEIANSIDIANQSAINADDKANLAQTATDNINTKLIEANNLIDEIVTDEQERILAENERISNENERIENEGIRDTEFTNKINDFVAETERVESEYPLRLTDVENSHTALKEEYVQYKDGDYLPVYNQILGDTKNEVTIDENGEFILIENIEEYTISGLNFKMYDKVNSSTVDMIVLDIEKSELNNEVVEIELTTGEIINIESDWRNDIPWTYYYGGSPSTLRITLPKGFATDIQNAREKLTGSILTKKATTPKTINITDKLNLNTKELIKLKQGGSSTSSNLDEFLTIDGETWEVV